MVRLLFTRKAGLQLFLVGENTTKHRQVDSTLDVRTFDKPVTSGWSFRFVARAGNRDESEPGAGKEGFFFGGLFSPGAPLEPPASSVCILNKHKKICTHTIGHHSLINMYQYLLENEDPRSGGPFSGSKFLRANLCIWPLPPLNITRRSRD